MLATQSFTKFSKYVSLFAAHSRSDPSALKGRLVRPLGLGRDARQVPPLAVLPVDDGAVLRHAVVPDDDGALLPLDAGLEVGAVRQVVVQELEQGVRLLALEADDFAGDCA